MPFPSTLSTFDRPATTDRLNNPSHSALHNTVSSAVGQIEQVIGRDGNNSVAGSLIYQIRSPDSDGGGHVQSANKGGTGQTTFTKGDMFVATSSSVIAKLAVGADTQILVADSSVAAGVKWASSGTRILNNASVITLVQNSPETSIVSTTVPASTLSTTGAVRARAFFSAGNGSDGSILLRATYGGNVVGSILMGDITTGFSVAGVIEYNIIANASNTVQRNILTTNITKQNPGMQSPTSVFGWVAYRMSTSSVNSAISNSFGMTMKTSGNTNIDIDGSTVEKIT